ncbi:hypothetical protein [[Erwinia] mediterraneensis]|uniref:hypothetical protein n=1 Tax=[Erwinia] mediterraneensis TaxID=2161819 RepID=UPI001A922125|nr:hypothetical protein [[Erwinia] mediterraneensis]
MDSRQIFAVGLACSLSADALLERLGWEKLNEMLLPWLAVAAAALIWQSSAAGMRQTKAKESVTDV